MPAHVRHEQADVVVTLVFGLGHVDETRRGIAHFVELQDRERRRLEALAGVGIVALVRERGTGREQAREAENLGETHD
jgi:hypothetical protein